MTHRSVPKHGRQYLADHEVRDGRLVRSARDHDDEVVPGKNEQPLIEIAGRGDHDVSASPCRHEPPEEAVVSRIAAQAPRVRGVKTSRLVDPRCRHHLYATPRAATQDQIADSREVHRAKVQATARMRQAVERRQEPSLTRYPEWLEEPLPRVRCERYAGRR